MLKYPLTIICLIWLQAFPSITIRPISDHISIKITHFSNDTSFKVIDELTKLTKNRPAPILIDLRNNSGGNLHSALTVGALFVTKNELIELESNEKTSTITRPNDLPLIAATKVIILANEKTASAAEACAYVLSHHPKSIIVGTNTIGKSNIHSNQSPNPKHTAFILPNHHVIPDIFVRFDNQTDIETIYLSAINITNHYLSKQDSTNKDRSISGN